MAEQAVEVKRSWVNDTNLRLAVIVLGLLGLAVSLYLVYIKFNPSSAMCLNAGDCEAVNTSRYSEVRGIPVAAIGAVGYLSMLVVLLLETRTAFLREWGRVAVFGMAFAGFLYSAYLTYIEVAVIHKICPYCVASAVIITLMLALSAVRLREML